MSKQDFISIFEQTLVSANLDIIGLSLVDDNTAQITFKGDGTREVNIEADSYSTIEWLIMKSSEAFRCVP